MTIHINPKVNTCLAVEYHWKVWKILGLQPPERESKWFKPYIIFSIILNLYILLFPLSFIINLILSKNLTELCENVCNTTSDLTCNIKFLNIILVRHKLLKVHTILKRLDARAKTRKELAILEEGIAEARKLFIVFASLCCGFFIAAQIVILFSNERVQIFPTWFPWDWKASKRNYLLTHLYMFKIVAIQTVQNFVSDTYPAAYLIILSAQIKALASRIKNLGINGKSSEEALYKELTDCIKDHDTIYKLFLNVQKSISTSCFIQFVATGLAQCTMGVYVLYVGIHQTKFLHSFIYFIGITTEIFILCYYGDLYCQANENLTKSIYACNWMDRDKKFKKTFLLLLQRSQRPSSITAGVLIPVRMPTFVKVLKTAYSVFTVLNNANSKWNS